MKAPGSYAAYRLADRQQLALARRVAGLSAKRLLGAILAGAVMAVAAWFAILATGLSLFVSLAGVGLALGVVAIIGAGLIYFGAEKLVRKGR